MDTPVAPNAQLNVRLEAQQWNIVLDALGQLPFKTVAPLMQNVVDQLQEQAKELHGQEIRGRTTLHEVPPAAG